ncbi:N-dimethylarginine dimethylaminohydrolase [Roseimicrobium gellanilyticum]|uniref:N-dimethylarginine dimethylaminohydrolase n=1 Tax=Roseimicrobium gellanilyticum TaxID=748857 RepID=A0A366HQ24_9BACT|nr:arginine deiminase-related protein [Roseimicrobium gellanilyticum]RBP45033.1 N-dimethylarginine dimethylaminohydrolase [Roseimicrobium gellanilyticum]
MNRMLLCPPDFYEVRYEINPWMSVAQAPDHAVAVRQWQGLYDTLQDMGCKVELLMPRPGWPDMVFTANAGVVRERRVLLSNFRHEERAGESPWHAQWFEEQDYEISRLPRHLAFEGEGDALKCGDVWICGHGFRTDEEAHRWVGDWTHEPMVSVRLVDSHFYHLDTCFCPLRDGLAMWYPAAFDAIGQDAIRAISRELIEVTLDEARRFACNAIISDSHVVMPDGCPKASAMLEGRDYAVHPLPMSEFIKAGGACKCLALVLE